MAKDPYRYFRVEARELLEGLTHGVLQLEKGAAGAEDVAALLRHAHTLKGAARVVKQSAIAELAHAVEGMLAPHRDAKRPLPPEHGSELLRALDAIAGHLRGLDAPPDAVGAEGARPRAEDTLETLRVEIPEMDSLLRGITEARVRLGALQRAVGTAAHLGELATLILDQLEPRRLDRASGSSPATLRVQSLAEELRVGLDRLQQSLTADVQRVHRELDAARDVADRLRLVPTRTVFALLERAVRDAAQSLGKSVEFEASGGDVRLDANVLAALRDALLHVVRNAVAHGLEGEGERVGAGKPATGYVRLKVKRRGARVSLSCQDDGRGVDVEAVRQAAVARGLLSAAEAASLEPDKVSRLLLVGGLTTTRQVTELSGRGIGLDVLREAVARLKGSASIVSEPGRGTTIEITVPVSLAVVTGLVVEAAGTAAVIPLDVIRRTFRAEGSDIATAGTGDSVLFEGKAVPLLGLDRALGRSGAAIRSNRPRSAVVVQVGDRIAAVLVDRILHTSEFVVRTLPAVVHADPIIAGATLDAEGNPQLVLDAAGLISAVERKPGAPTVDAVPRPPPVLVVDDSLTTRMLEQSILESAGYEVDLAVSGEDALSKARQRRYGIFIVDVEMPGIDGFEFVARSRKDPDLRDTPAILVTSRDAPEDRLRGREVGAHAYIVKSEFDQGQLLHTIRTLIG